MKFRAIYAALLPATLAVAMLGGCGASTMHLGANGIANGALRAKDAPAAGVDPAPFLDTASQAIGTILKSTDWKNPSLVSIEGHGLDKSGKLVPLLGGSWVFKFWANKVEGGQMATDFSMVQVIRHVEGTTEIVDTGDIRQTDIVRVLDPSKLSQPTQIVPFAIRLGLKVSHAGAGYNYYDVTYNAFYADPSSAEANVADVSAYYQNSVIDLLHIPADAGLLPALPTTVAPAAAPAPKAAGPAPAPKATPRRATPTEMAADQDRDRRAMSRQHL
jgi:hypothetical protein